MKLVNDGKSIIVANKKYKKSMYKQVGQNATKTMYNLKGHFSATRAKERAGKN